MSRLRSSRGSNAPKTRAAAPARSRGVLVQSPKSDIFVALLGIALGALVIACLLMLILLWRYDFKVNAKLAAVDPAPRVLHLAAHPASVSPGTPAC